MLSGTHLRGVCAHQLELVRGRVFVPESIRSMICDGVCVKVCDLGFVMNYIFGATFARGGCAHQSKFVGGRGFMPDNIRANIDAFGHTFARGVCSST